jgi:hypothetical protein
MGMASSYTLKASTTLCTVCNGSCERELASAEARAYGGATKAACARLADVTPVHTPWGAVSHVERMGELRFISSSSHGGFWLDAAQMERVPACVKLATFNLLGVSGWFEEDNDANYVVALFPEVFGEQRATAAVGMLDLGFTAFAKHMDPSRKAVAFMALRCVAALRGVAISTQADGTKTHIEHVAV